jgi:hypothetical protein
VPAIDVDFNGPAVLVVAWRTGRNAHGRVVKAGGDVMASLEGYAQRAVQDIQVNEGRRYDPNDAQDEECVYLEADHDELLDAALLGEIQRGASLPQATTEDLKKRTLAVYALVVGSDPDQLTIFARRGNPVQLAKKSLVAVFDDTLMRVVKPLLAFDESYDVIISSSSVLILDQKNFEGIFKESEAVLARTSEWAHELSEALPMSTESEDWLSEQLRKNVFMRRRVQSILKSEYLAKLTPEFLRAKMIENDLEPEKLMNDDGLIIAKETAREILLLLNEDLWTGDFSGQQYAATNKSRRQ